MDHDEINLPDDLDPVKAHALHEAVTLLAGVGIPGTADLEGIARSAATVAEVFEEYLR
jgi:hypothetical protein